MNPVITLFGESIYAYPLFMGIAWGVGYHIVRYEVARLSSSLKGFYLFFWGNFIASWLGAKIFFLLFSSGDQALQHSLHHGFWLGGGFVFLGGLVFGLLYTFLLIGFFKKFSLDLASRSLAGVAIGHGIGRIGCFLAGCCYGEICELPWKVYLHGTFRHPVQLYEALSLFLLGFLMFKLNRKDLFPLKRITIYLLSYSILRFFLEFFRGDLIRGEYASLSSSQWVSLFLVGLSIVLLKRGKKSV